MNIALLLGAGAGLTWLTGNPNDTREESDEIMNLKDLVQMVIKNPKTKRRLSEPYNASEFPSTTSRHSTRGEGESDQEEIEGKEYVNPKQELKAITTDLVNRKFLSQKADIFRFLRLVIDTHMKAIEIYVALKELKPNQVRFVYKGGNVLRIVANEFLIELPGYASELVNDFYMRYFKRSDADFSIYIDPKLKNFEEVHTDLTQLTLLLQQNIRERILAKPNLYYEYFRLNEYEQTLILESYLKELNASDTVQDPTNEQFYQGEFEGIRFEDRTAGLPPWGNSQDVDTFISPASGASKDTITFVPRPDLTHYMRIQYNTALEFGAGGAEEKASFNLVRTKMIFAVRFKREDGSSRVVKIGGELIDVSLPKKADSGLAHFFDTPNAIDNYELRFKDKSLRFLGYSIAFLIDDLDLILFIRNEKPWNDRKYVKRLNRLFYMCFVETFVKFGSNTERRNYMRELCEKVITQAYEPDLKKRGDSFVAKWKKKGPEGFNRFAKRFTDIAIPKTDPDFSEYQEFVELVQQNCIVVLKAFKTIGQFCTVGANLPEERIYEGNFNALIPGE